MATGNGWYLVGPLIAVGLVGLLGTVFRRMGLHWTLGREPVLYDGEDDYGLLGPAAIADSPEIADEIRQLLGDAGIRATHAITPDGHTAILVFAEQLEEARRVVNAY
jgi:hypothetical protein